MQLNVKNHSELPSSTVFFLFLRRFLGTVAFLMSVFLPGFPTNWRREDGLVVSLLAWKSGGRRIESTHMRRYSTYFSQVYLIDETSIKI